MITKARSVRPFLLNAATAVAFALLFSQCAVPGTAPRYGYDAAESEAVPNTVTKKSRPGLGTSWGEGRSSPVTGTDFARASSRPSGMLAIRYNDADGTPDGKWSTSQPFWVAHTATVGIKSKGRYLKAYSTGSGPVVIGEDGERYSIYVRNRTDKRIEVVLSVDGLDVMDGRPASHGKRGYVIAPRGRLEVEGFRRSFESVAAFRFGSVDSSYAARRGASTRNVGVIGVAVFKERDDKSDWHIRKHADPFPGERGSGQFAQPPH